MTRTKNVHRPLVPSSSRWASLPRDAPLLDVLELLRGDLRAILTPRLAAPLLLGQLHAGSTGQPTTVGLIVRLALALVQAALRLCL